MKGFNLKDWKVHLMCLLIVIASELIGNFKFVQGILSFTLFPMLYALIIGAILAIVKVIDLEMMKTASPYIGISVTLLTCKVGSTIGPNLEAVLKAGPALLLQELGNLGPILFSMPIAIFVFNMGREAVGATFSISREGSLAVIGDLYGLDSAEGRGVMGAYVTGTLLGTIFNSLMSSAALASGLFHPFALAMACGTGSASMMTAALAPLIDKFSVDPTLMTNVAGKMLTVPQMVAQMQAYAAGSQILTGIDGLYINLFVAIPFTNWFYRKLKKIRNPGITEAEMAPTHKVK